MIELISQPYLRAATIMLCFLNQPPKKSFKFWLLAHGLLLQCLLATGAWALPGFAEVKAHWQPSEAYLLDRHGQLLQALRLDFKARRLPWVALKDISPALTNALLTAEDRRFWQHHGVDWKAVASASLGRIWGKQARGASTITMQLAALLDPKLATGKGGRSLGQKWAQMQGASELEAGWSKPEILEAYLNLTGFRSEVQGIAAIAQVYFGKQASGLTEAEALLLAAVLPSPNTSALHIGQRACAIAQAANSSIDCPALKNLAVSTFERPPHAVGSANFAPHLARQLLHKPGESLRSSLDLNLQKLAYNALNQQLHSLLDRNVRDGAALVLDNQNGEVLAYVGSAGPYSKSPKVDGVRALRQAGSTLKPFLYCLALEKRYLTAATILEDAPVRLETPSGLYIPQNYEHDYKGKVSVRTALAGSLNIPAVRTLVLLGVDRFVSRLQSLGYTSINQSGEYYGFSLALGSAEVNLLEQANAYRTLARGGVYSALHLLPDEAPSEQKPVMDTGAAYIIGDILSDRAGRALTFGLSNPLATRYWSAVKTGTSKDMRDNWCIGFSQRYTVAVWVGNFEGDSMHDVSGVTGAAPAWLEIMNYLAENQPSDPPNPPDDLVHQTIQFEPALEPARTEWFIAGTETNIVRLTPPQTQAPRILSPANGVIIALDPDIPYEHQAVTLKSNLQEGHPQFRLDGKTLGPARQSLKWRPLPGLHRLELVGAKGEVLDKLEFSVRGLNK